MCAACRGKEGLDHAGEELLLLETALAAVLLWLSAAVNQENIHELHACGLHVSPTLSKHRIPVGLLFSLTLAMPGQGGREGYVPEVMERGGYTTAFFRDD